MAQQTPGFESWYSAFVWSLLSPQMSGYFLRELCEDADFFAALLSYRTSKPARLRVGRELFSRVLSRKLTWSRKKRYQCLGWERKKDFVAPQLEKAIDAVFVLARSQLERYDRPCPCSHALHCALCLSGDVECVPSVFSAYYCRSLREMKKVLPSSTLPFLLGPFYRAKARAHPCLPPARVHASAYLLDSLLAVLSATGGNRTHLPRRLHARHIRGGGTGI